MSSAILYLAIVAIWAIFLVPYWIKRPHAGTTAHSDEEDAFAPDPDLLTEEEIDAEQVIVDRYEDTGSERIQFEEPGYAETSEFAGAPVGRPPYADDLAGPADDFGEAPAYEHAAYEYEYAEDYPAQAPAREDGRQAPLLTQSREEMFRARRRLLAILIGLTVLTALATAAGLVQWWICVPPVILLGLYLLLLREASLADAKLASKRAAYEARMAVAQRRRDRQAGVAGPAEPREAPAAEMAPPVQEAPTAEIIDISERVADQFYDQYADAEVRAVGD